MLEAAVSILSCGEIEHHNLHIQLPKILKPSMQTNYSLYKRRSGIEKSSNIYQRNAVTCALANIVK